MSYEHEKPIICEPLEWVLERIMTETGKSLTDAEKLRGEFSRINPTFQEELIRWWNTGVIDMDRTCHGWSIRRLIAERRSKHVCQAIAWMSLLNDDPEKAQNLLATNRGQLMGNRKPR